MLRICSFAHYLEAMIYTLMAVLLDAARFLMLCWRPVSALAAENHFLRKQLARYQEHQVKSRRANDAMRLTMVWLSRFFDWRRVLVIVQPTTLIRWHRHGFRLRWRWRSKPGRPTLPKDLQTLIRRVPLENPTWGQERIANVACDFCVALTASFRVLYVFVVIEHASRRLLHVNVPAHPTAEWTIQPFREAISADHTYRILIHDRDTIFSKAVDQRVSHMGLHVIKTPVRTPGANSICERMIGTLRRDCLDFMIPLNQRHLYRILKEWVACYNASRPHMSLVPGIPQPSFELPVPRQAYAHPIRVGLQVRSRPVLGGLHHHYELEQKAA